MRSPKLRRTNPNMLSSADNLLPSLPFDLIPEILSRLPVKSLLQFRCVCKSWKSLISDPNFAKKHLNLSTPRRLLLYVSYDNPLHMFILNSYSLQSIFTESNYNFTRFEFPLNVIAKQHAHYIVGSCDGIVCVANYHLYADFRPIVILWNPSIRKVKELPPFENQPELNRLNYHMTYGFGYDHVSHDYKVVVLYNSITMDTMSLTRAKVYTLKADSWRTIQPYPSDFGILVDYEPGRYLSGSINWVASTTDYLCASPTDQLCIVSFDLVKETFQRILPPGQPKHFRLSVLKDWLCIIFDQDVWVMKEYGNVESWTKLFNVTHLLDPLCKSFNLTNVLYIFEDDQVLLMFKKATKRLSFVYNSKNDTSKVSFMFPNIPNVCVESLISPWS